MKFLLPQKNQNYLKTLKSLFLLKNQKNHKSQKPYKNLIPAPSDSTPIFAQLCDKDIHVKRSDLSNRVAENFLLFAYDPKESSVSTEKQTVSKKDDVTEWRDCATSK